MEDKEISSQDFSPEEFSDVENQEILAQNAQSIESSLFEQNASDEQIDDSVNFEKNQELTEENAMPIENSADVIEEQIENVIEDQAQEEISIPQEEYIQNEIQKEPKETIQQPKEKTIQNIAPSISEDEEFEEPVEKLVTVRPVKFQQFENTPPICSIKKNLDIMQDITMHVSVELGRTKSSIREVMEMEKGSIVELDKIAGEQVEIYVNEKLVAKGEVIVIEDKFGVRVTSTNLTNPNQNY